MPLNVGTVSQMVVPGRTPASSAPQMVGVTFQFSVLASSTGEEQGRACVGAFRARMERACDAAEN